MPEGAEYSRGRFIAQSPQFLDLALYKREKKITVAGEIIGRESKPLGKTEYTSLWSWRNRFIFGKAPNTGPIILLLTGIGTVPAVRALFWGFHGDVGEGDEDEEGETAILY